MNKDLKIFVISGKAGHGKDTVATILKQELDSRGHRVLVTHYADLVKYICTTFFDWDGKKDVKGRALLQAVGTDVGRKYNPNYWVKFVADMLMMFGENWDYVLIPDARFLNEVEGLKEYFNDVKHIRVVRDNFTSNLTATQLKHISEIELDGIEPDYLIINNGDLSDLMSTIKEGEWYNA
jgi:hypothetical protein